MAEDHPGCCSACKGTGSDTSGPCSDCYGTGHPHPLSNTEHTPYSAEWLIERVSGLSDEKARLGVVHEWLGRHITSAVMSSHAPASPRPPGEGHTFRFDWSSRGFYGVVGSESTGDADWWSPPVTIEVRAWGLKDAIEKFGSLPFMTLLGYPDEEDETDG